MSVAKPVHETCLWRRGTGEQVLLLEPEDSESMERLAPDLMVSGHGASGYGPGRTMQAPDGRELRTVRRRRAGTK